MLDGAVRASEPWVKLWGALGLIRGGHAVPPEVFQQVAAWPDCRITLARELEALERPDLFPNDFLNQPGLAEATMVDWLLFPTELGRAPDEIRQLQVMPLETNDGLADLYVFAFRTHAPHWLSEKDWVVGVAGVPHGRPTDLREPWWYVQPLRELVREVCRRARRGPSRNCGRQFRNRRLTTGRVARDPGEGPARCPGKLSSGLCAVDELVQASNWLTIGSGPKSHVRTDAHHS